MPDLPADAITAAAKAVIRSPLLPASFASYAKTVAMVVLNDAAPALRAQAVRDLRASYENAGDAYRAEGAAAEREACAQLADEVGARYTTHELPDYTTSGRVPMHHRFADLIRARSQP